jgi:Raf kinase inhibitor-like YbhB/YbcL family protein
VHIESTAFEHMAAIPPRYTCDGEDISPPLAWDGAPNDTRSFVLIVDDPDAPDPAAPKRVYVHWVLYDIPASARGLAEGTTSASLPAGTREGTNDFGHTHYGGPCPPIGRHRYFHKLYALDITLGDRGPLTKAQVLDAMADHVRAEAQLVGTYQRSR